MNTKEKIQLTAIGKNDYFKKVIEKLTLNQELSSEESTYILSCAILFLKGYEEDKKMLSYADVAYYIILKYSLNSKDYKPLYDFSVNFGFYPIVKVILENKLLKNLTISDYIINPKIENFKHIDGYTETLNQHNTRKRFIEDFSFEKGYIAPTSFGKSSVILEYIKSIKNYQKFKIVIVVPTKSLLMQTYKMIQAANLESKIIIHDDMYNNENFFIAIFTQERALRLIKKGVSFDVIIIDEAHKLLENKRGILISRLIKQNNLLNINQKVIYLSPLIENISNLQITNGQNISDHRISFNLKEPEFFEFNIKNKKSYKYNRFINKFYNLTSFSNLNTFSYFEKNAQNKNFIFENGPQKIELLAKNFCESGSINKINESDDIKNLKKILIEKIHKDYFAIQYLDYGIVYIHGQLPELLKEYLEYKFVQIPTIKYIIANTVILEGMNLPIDTLFICGSRNISNGKSLLNLVGRVNRLDSIFNGYKKENLDKLLPRVHIINSGDSEHDPRFEKYLRSRVFKDEIRNPTLPAYDIEKDIRYKSITKQEDKERFIKKIERLQSYEKFIYKNSSSEKDIVKKYFIENSINNYYDDTESAINSFITTKNSIFSTNLNTWQGYSMMEKIAKAFIPDVNNIIDYEFKRLSKEPTQKYYEGYLKIAIKQSLKANIDWQVRRFDDIINNTNISRDKKSIYIGDSYGDTVWPSNDWRDSNRKVYKNLLGKSQEELTNIAIVKLQIEENFVSFTLNKFIRALYDFSLISENEYNLYTYGTDDVQQIALQKQGLNLSLITRLQEDDQLKNIERDQYNNLIGNEYFHKYLETIDDFYKFEIKRYIN